MRGRRTEREGGEKKEARSVNARLQLPRFLNQLPSLLGTTERRTAKEIGEKETVARERETKSVQEESGREEIAKRYLNIARARNSMAMQRAVTWLGPRISR